MDFDDALEHLKKIVIAEVPADKIEQHAFRLVGESLETIDREAQELFQELLRQSPPVPHATKPACNLSKPWAWPPVAIYSRG
jgi:hypothetical protein